MSQRGSTTACVLCLEGERLHAANVGDSGFMVVRENEIVFKSPPQQHSFNFPYQLGPKEKGYQTPNDAQVSSQMLAIIALFCRFFHRSLHANF